MAKLSANSTINNSPIKVGIDYVDPVLQTIDSPIGDEISGIRYLISNTASGIFSGKENLVAQFLVDRWHFADFPDIGQLLYIQDLDDFYFFDGINWIPSTITSSVAVGDGPPHHPKANSLWWQSNTGILSIFYNDGNSSQWVDASPQSSGSNSTSSSEGTTISVSDSPPANANANSLWWQSNTGTLFIRYADSNSIQWVAATPQGFAANTDLTNLGITVNIAFNTANIAFGKANQDSLDIAVVFNTANLGFGVANLAFGQANTSNNQPIQNNGTLVASRNKINFIPGDSITLNIADDSIGNRVNVIINSTATGGSNVTVSDAPPSPSVANTLWWQSNTGILFIYYNDGNSSQWVTASPSFTADVAAAYGVANAAFLAANVAQNVAQSAFATANAASGGSIQAAFNAANAAFLAANSSFAKANQDSFDATAAFIAANAAFGSGNTNAVNITSAFAKANQDSLDASAAFGAANSAFSKANLAVMKAGDTMTGNLVMSAANISFSTGNTGVFWSGFAYGSSPLANTIVWVTSNIERLRITNDGSVNVASVLLVNGMNVKPTIVGAYNQANTAETDAQVGITNAGNAFGAANAAFLQANIANNLPVQNNGSLIASRTIINFLPGTSISFNIADDSVGNRINVKINYTGAAVSVGDGPPPSPSANSLWWQSNTGILKIYYADANSSQWVDASAPSIGGDTAKVFVSDIPPVNPTANSLWWQSNVGILKILYADSNSSQWVDTSPSIGNASDQPFGEYTVAQVASLSPVPSGRAIMVTNESGGYTMAFTDGTNWRRVQDRAIVS